MADENIPEYWKRFATHKRMYMDAKTTERNLLEIKEVLDKGGIPFWLMFGTFLGAYRDGTLIPWDGDSDLAIRSEDLSLFFKCSLEFERRGFQRSVWIRKPHTWFTDRDPMVLRRYNEHTDLHFFRLQDNKRKWAEYSCDASAFDISETVYFLNTLWKILGNPEKWLHYIYGPDWRTPRKNVQAHTGVVYPAEGNP